MHHLNDKVAIITGASSGIGRATALALAQAGADVALAARREDALEAVAEDVRGSDAAPWSCLPMWRNKLRPNTW